VKIGSIIGVAACLILFLVSGLEAQPARGTAAPAVADGKRSQPIKIDADRLEAHNEKRTVTFIGNVVAVQEGRTIRADRVTLFYKKEGARAAQPSRDPLRGGELDRIEARGKVSIQMEDRIATGDEAVMLQDAQQIILTGNATLREGPNIVTGEKVTVFLEENRGIVEGSDKIRVRAVIYTETRETGTK
jgi:lipopolysaccharide export system protein LptA